jgi:hypothetical protein
MKAESIGNYPILCEWCPTHGRAPAVIRMVNYPGSDGICPKCKEELINGEKSRKAKADQERKDSKE